MTIEITNPADQRFIKALIFGPPGQGKTHFLGTAQDDPRTSPMLLLDFEGGHETLAGLDIDVIEIRSWDDYNEAYELLAGDDHGYKSVGIDSISETHVWALLEILRTEGAARRDPELLEMRDYGKATVQLRRLLREFRDLPMHVFYTATTKEVEERGVGKVKVPNMSGQMADEVAGLMSVAGYMAIAEDEEEGGVTRTLLLQNYPGFRVKARAPWTTEVPDEIESPTVGALLDVMNVAAPKKRRSKAAAKKGSDNNEED